MSSQPAQPSAVGARELPANITVLGSGSWGTTFAKVIADAAVERGDHDLAVMLWARRDDVAAAINERHVNPEYLDEIDLPESIRATTDLKAAVEGAEVIVLAVPAQHVREQLHALKDALGEDTVIVSLVKGLERGTDERISEICASELDLDPENFAVVSGPNLAMEIARREPTATVVASASEQTAAKIAKLTNCSYFRPYRNTDVTGVEIGGVVKNVIALAVGLCDGRGFGDNSKASIITRGLAETTRLAAALGARQETMAGLAGLGDLVATCASPLSRNRTAGRFMGEGYRADELSSVMRQTAEGVKSVSAVVELAHRMRVEMPISEAMNAVVSGALDVESLATLLLARDLKSEASS
ncbi:NAD(P)H-dependent glycerol-3-phosphate dehydrogenase [Citricoccus muralis]|uniref:Glycerol-3-phosphate dehydrogenase [NAD(P)+] n=1 Tax=Citricoccus muralis TaxID=169134 RepID=A0ABY8HAK8_9MICC|nr:NAD(P)H-dependent glycerol-3-phosphate dehydrogenase [Citricoccus muralis]WFP17740.1 NAD(P)-dependent glycerol-3-phosphate dehydrogenase [Citricoccus muralis]